MSGCCAPSSFFADSQSAFMERFGGGVIALRLVKLRQIVERYGHARVLRSESFFFDSQSAFIERFGGGVIALLVVKQSQQVNRQSDVSVIFAETCFSNFEGFAGNGDSAAIIALFPQFVGFLEKNIPLQRAARYLRFRLRLRARRRKSRAFFLEHFRDPFRWHRKIEVAVFRTQRRNSDQATVFIEQTAARRAECYRRVRLNHRRGFAVDVPQLRHNPARERKFPTVGRADGENLRADFQAARARHLRRLRRRRIRQIRHEQQAQIALLVRARARSAHRKCLVAFGLPDFDAPCAFQNMAIGGDIIFAHDHAAALRDFFSDGIERINQNHARRGLTKNRRRVRAPTRRRDDRQSDDRANALGERLMKRHSPNYTQGREFEIPPERARFQSAARLSAARISCAVFSKSPLIIASRRRRIVRR